MERFHGIEFKPIDLERHAPVCVRFREDSFLCSFGSAERFHEADGNGAERYLAWLARRMEELPGSGVHVWDGPDIIGQMEMGRSRGDAATGYVNLFYLVPERRGSGVAARLDEHAAAFFRRLGLRAARLTVSPANRRAVRFYEKCGWKDLGPHPDDPLVHYMEKSYAG